MAALALGSNSTGAVVLALETICVHGCDAAATRYFAALQMRRRVHAYVPRRWQRRQRGRGPSDFERR